MDISEFIKQRKSSINNVDLLQNEKDFNGLIHILEGKKIRYELNENRNVVEVSFQETVWLDSNIQITLNKNIKIYLVGKFYCIENIYGENCYNIKLNDFVWDELSFYSLSTTNLLEKSEVYDATNNSSMIFGILRGFGYKEINLCEMYTRFPVYFWNSDVPPMHLIGAQPYLYRLLEFGFEYEPTMRDGYNTLLVGADVDHVLGDCSTAIVNLANYVTYQSGNFIVKGLKEKEHLEVIKVIDEWCKALGGDRLPDTLMAYHWSLGTSYSEVGNIHVRGKVQLHLSRYMDAFYVAFDIENNIMGLKDCNLRILTRKVGVGADKGVFVEHVNNMQYEAVFVLSEKYGYKHLNELNYKLSVKCENSECMHEVELGELIFDLPPESYTYIDKVEWD